MGWTLSRVALAACLAVAAVGGVGLELPGAADAEQISRGSWLARWITAPGTEPTGAAVLHFRKSFDLAEAPKAYLVDVSADNRYRLYVNGTEVSSGPARGDVLNWRYETVDLAPYLHAGHNTVAALVWNWGDLRPVAQMSLRTGFLLQGQGDTTLNTNGTWKVSVDRGYSFTAVDKREIGGLYIAAPGEIVDEAQVPWGWEGAGFDDSAWPAAMPIANAQARASDLYGVAQNWQLVPRNIPPMDEHPQAFSRIRRADGIAADSGFIKGGKPLVIPPHTRASVLVDQDYETKGYVVLTSSGGAGSTVKLTYAEALFDKKGQKGNRDDIEGRTIHGVQDQIRPDGGNDRRYQTLWFRTFRYVQVDIETQDQPLTVKSLNSVYSGYPLTDHASFKSDQAWIDPIWDIDWRVLRLSAFETYMDTPLYEQLQYVGDARIESLLTLYSDGDDRLMRNAIETYDASRGPEGLTMARYPSAPGEYIPPFSLIWIYMVHDYWMLRDDPAFVKRFVPGTRTVLDWYEKQVDETGLLGPMPWWNFVDWAYPERGVAPGGDKGHSVTITLQYVYALQQAAELEQSLGHAETAARYRGEADKLIANVRVKAWNADRGLFVDSLEKASFSQQTNALAVLTGAAADKPAVMRHVLDDKDLTQASYYFRFYVDEAMHAAGLSDRYLERLAPWQDMIKLGLTSTPETPEPTRSDAHAWSAHPNYHLLATVLGVRPASPGFRTVEIAPALGTLKTVEGHVPHPAGDIGIVLRRVGATGVSGVVSLPPALSGTFKWNGQTVTLRGRKNAISLK